MKYKVLTGSLTRNYPKYIQIKYYPSMSKPIEKYFCLNLTKDIHIRDRLQSVPRVQ